MIVFIFQLFLSLILFFIINWIGKNSSSFGYRSVSISIQEEDDFAAFNFIFKVFSSVIYLIIISTICYSFKQDYLVKDIYFVSIYYIVIRFVVSFVSGKLKLVNWKKQIIYWISLIIASLFVYNKLIITKVSILPDFKTMSNEVWLIILAFLYGIFDKIGKSKIEIEKDKIRKTTSLKKNIRYFKRNIALLLINILKLKNLSYYFMP